jgi:predicted transcriptional regulator
MKRELTDFHITAAELVAAYIGANEVDAERIPELLQIAYRGLLNMDASPATLHALPPAKKPTVPIDKSVHDDYIICLEDGVQLKMLKRYLRTNYNMTFEQYRARWGLPKTYPSTAPNYTRQRSKLAKDRGLGRKPKK